MTWSTVNVKLMNWKICADRVAIAVVLVVSGLYTLFKSFIYFSLQTLFNISIAIVSYWDWLYLLLTENWQIWNNWTLCCCYCCLVGCFVAVPRSFASSVSALPVLARVRLFFLRLLCLCLLKFVRFLCVCSVCTCWSSSTFSMFPPSVPRVCLLSLCLLCLCLCLVSLLPMLLFFSYCVSAVGLFFKIYNVSLNEDHLYWVQS